jgi:hypothetical protein
MWAWIVSSLFICLAIWVVIDFCRYDRKAMRRATERYLAEYSKKKPRQF